MCFVTVDSGRQLATNVHAVGHNFDTARGDLAQLQALILAALRDKLATRDTTDTTAAKLADAVVATEQILSRITTDTAALFALWAELAGPQAIEAHNSMPAHLTHKPHLADDGTRNVREFDPYAERAHGEGHRHDADATK